MNDKPIFDLNFWMPLILGLAAVALALAVLR